MIRVTPDILFATHDGVELRGDLYCPEGGGPHPVLVAAPGGAWLRGHRRDLKHWGQHLAANGIALFVSDYRRSVGGRIFPENVQDLLSAIRFVNANAPEMGLDRNRLGVLGASAGAHLAALVALAGQSPTFSDAYPDEGAVRPVIRVFVGVYGVYDLVSHWQADLARNSAPGEDHTERMLGVTPYDDQLLYFEASPVRHVTYAGSELKVMLIYGDADTDVLPEQTTALARALTQARYFVRTLPVPGAGHFWFSDEPLDMPHGHNAYVAPRLVRFLNRHLAGTP